MLWNCRYVRKRKEKKPMYQVFTENYKDIPYLNDNNEIDYPFFIVKYIDALGGINNLSRFAASEVYKRLEIAIKKAEERNDREIKFEDTDTEDESSEDGENGQNGQSDGTIMKKAEQERYTNCVEKRLTFLLITEPSLLLDNIHKRKKFIRKILRDTHLNVPQVIGMIRCPPAVD